MVNYLLETIRGNYPFIFVGIKLLFSNPPPLSPSVDWMQLLTQRDDGENLNTLPIIEHLFYQKP
jgi:hypothetical protein